MASLKPSLLSSRKKYVSVANTSLCKVDYSVTSELMMTMDYDGGWKKLAIAAGKGFDEILPLEDIRSRGQSATSELLWGLGCSGYKVKDLYELLASINRRLEMTVLENYARKYNEPPLGREYHQSTQVSAAKKETEKEEKDSGASYFDRETILRQIEVPDFDEPGAAAAPISAHVASSTKVSGTNASGTNVSGTNANRTNASGSNANPSSVGVVDYNQLPLVQPQYGAESKPGLSNKHIPGTEKESVESGVSRVFGLQTKASNPQQQMRRASPTESVDGTQETWTDNNQSTAPPSSTSSIKGSGAGPSACKVGEVQNPSPSCPESIMSLRESYKYRDLQNATANFAQSNFIGEGAFGCVYKGSLKGFDIAVKCLKKTEDAQEAKVNLIAAEVSLLLEFCHEHIVVLYGHSLDGPQPCLVYQYLENGSLEDRLALKNGTPPLMWERRLNILVGACKGLNFLHTFRGGKPVIHGDIKSANILLDQDLKAKLADLGQAKNATGVSKDTTGFTHVTVVETRSKMFGTKAYHAPEVCRSGQISIKSDIYAMGVVFLEVCSGLPAYDPNRAPERCLAYMFKDQEKHQWATDFCDKHLGVIPESSFKEVLTLANVCVSDKKNERPKTVKLLEGIKDCHSKYNSLLAEQKNQSLSMPAHVCCHESSQQLQYLMSSMSLMASNTSVVPSTHPLQQGQHVMHGPQHANLQHTSPQHINFQQANPQQSTGLQYTGPQHISPQHSIITNNCSNLHQPPSGVNPTMQPAQPNTTHTLGGANVGETSLIQQPEQDTTTQPSITPISVESQFGESLALQLQLAHDKFQAERERLRRQGIEDFSSLDEQFHLEVEEIRHKSLGVSVENSTKQQQSTDSGSNAGQKPSTVSTSCHEGGMSEFPKSDPKKLEKLLAFDRANMSNGIDESNNQGGGDVVYKCDPKKLAQLRQFDDENSQTFNASGSGSGCVVDTISNSPASHTNCVQSSAVNHHFIPSNQSGCIQSMSTTTTNIVVETKNMQQHVTHNGFHDSTSLPEKTYNANYVGHQFTPQTCGKPPDILHHSNTQSTTNNFSHMSDSTLKNNNNGVHISFDPDSHISGTRSEQGRVYSYIDQQVNNSNPDYKSSNSQPSDVAQMDNCYVGHYRDQVEREHSKKSDLDDLMADLTDD